MRIGGVMEVLSFDEDGIMMETTCGLLLLKGAGMHIGKLDLEAGDVVVDGSIDLSLIHISADAIDKKDMKNLCEELGDVLMQVVFHAEIETEQGGFTMGDVIDVYKRQPVTLCL